LFITMVNKYYDHTGPILQDGTCPLSPGCEEQRGIYPHISPQDICICIILCERQDTSGMISLSFRGKEDLI
jgi:hypothetical protein